MLRNVLLAGLFAVTLAVSGSGCCVDSCGVRRGPLGRARPGPIDCECGGHGCGMCRMGLFGLARYRATCGAGCGEMYLDEWASDPPDCCDPCDDGMCRRGCRGGCGGGIMRRGGLGLFGRRYRPAAEYGYGFSAGHDEMIFDDVHEGTVIEGDSTPRPAPREAPTPAARQTQSAIKKTSSRQPYYEQGHQHPHTMGRPGYGWQSAANPPYPMPSRVMR